MKYLDLLNYYEKNLIIKPQDVYFWGNEKTIRSQLSRWAKFGKLIELRKGYYLLPQKLRKFPPLFYIANVIYMPSYISLQSALSFYNLIPEAVYSITSVTTRTTYEINNKVGNFIYRKIKNDLFFDYVSININDYPVFIAKPEKALLDTVYIDHVEEKSLRLQNSDLLNKDKLEKLLKNYPKWVKKNVEEIL